MKYLKTFEELSPETYKSDSDKVDDTKSKSDNDHSKQDLIAKQFIDQLKTQMGNKNPIIKIDTDKDSIEINESSASLDFMHLLSDLVKSKNLEFVRDIYKDARILTVSKDVDSVLGKFSEKNKLTNILSKIFKAIYNGGRWIISWFETFVNWIASNILGYTPSTTNLISKSSMLALTLSTIIVVYHMFEAEMMKAIITGSFTLLISSIALKIVATLLLCNKIYSVVKRIIEIYKVKKSEHILTISELFDHFVKKFKHPVSARDLQIIGQWYEELDSSKIDSLTDLLEILKKTSDKRIDRFETIPYLNFHFGLVDNKNNDSLEEFLKWLEKYMDQNYNYHDFWYNYLKAKNHG